MTPIPPDTSPTTDELRAAVHKLVASVVQVARAEHGLIPGVGSPAWWTAPTSARLAALLVLAEAYLLADPERMALQMLREAAYNLSGAHDWSAASRRPSHTDLARRRAAPGPLAGLVFDTAAAQRWVQTGDSQESAA